MQSLMTVSKPYRRRDEPRRKRQWARIATRLPVSASLWFVPSCRWCLSLAVRRRAAGARESRDLNHILWQDLDIVIQSPGPHDRICLGRLINANFQECLVDVHGHHFAQHEPATHLV